MLTFDPLEQIRSVQLYGVDPLYVGQAVDILGAEFGVHHVDLNFGCPVPKVTRKGGGAALPWKRGLLRDILDAAVKAAAPYGIPVTMKTRMGIDADHLTYLDAGRIAQDAGCDAIALHGRTADQHYSGSANWDAIAALKQHVDIPVLGNGDIWEASDAIAMMQQTGCDGVVIGRGCLGRPWLFRDLAAAFNNQQAPPRPDLAYVTATLRRHAELLADLMGEQRGLADLRKHMAWYFKGFIVGSDIRSSLGQVSSLDELDVLLARIDTDQPFPLSEVGVPRGRQGTPRRVVLPDGWLDSQEHAVLGADAELDLGGG